MTKAIEELRLATNWAMAGDISAACDFTYSALLGFVRAGKAEEKDQPE